MKKTLVFAMAMALGVTATAFAANPFSDVPAGHWAYGAVAKLAAAGVIDGYPDGTFEGGKTITRYEMAQMIAKAMAKGAIGADDKLVSEFASELDNLGVRVAKLEKKADNVKISGVIRYSYKHYKTGDVNGSQGRLRNRLYFKGEVNKNWEYNGMIQNNSGLCGADHEGHDESITFKEAYLVGKYGDFKAQIGRYNTIAGNAYLWDERVDAIRLEYGKDFKVYAEGGKLWSCEWNPVVVGGSFWQAGVAYDAKNFGVGAEYFSGKDVKNYFVAGADYKVLSLMANYKGKNWGIGATYMKGSNDAVDDLDLSNTGWVIDAHYAGAEASKPGTWGVYATYYNQGAGTVIAHTMNGNYYDEGFKGWMAGVNFTVAKNMVAAFEYYDLKSKLTDEHKKTMWTQLVVTF